MREMQGAQLASPWRPQHRGRSSHVSPHILLTPHVAAEGLQSSWGDGTIGSHTAGRAAATSNESEPPTPRPLPPHPVYPILSLHCGQSP